MAEYVGSGKAFFPQVALANAGYAQKDKAIPAKAAFKLSAGKGAIAARMPTILHPRAYDDAVAKGLISEADPQYIRGRAHV